MSKKPYLAPQTKSVEIKLEQHLLTASLGTEQFTVGEGLNESDWM